jgi:hypothetical protein
MLTHIWNTSPLLAIFWSTFLPFVALILLRVIDTSRLVRTLGRETHSDIVDAVGPRHLDSHSFRGRRHDELSSATPRDNSRRGLAAFRSH